MRRSRSFLALATSSALCTCLLATTSVPVTAAIATTTPPGSDSPSSGTPPLRLELVADGFVVPRHIVDAGDSRLLVSDQIGVVRVVVDDEVQDEPFLDLGDDVLPPGAGHPELGLAGFTLAPDFETSGLVYTFHSAPPGDDAPPNVRRVDTITEWTIRPDGAAVDPESERVLLAYPQTFFDHVGGELTFGDDGFLYAGFGAPSGSATAQDPSTLDGSIIRIDVSSGDPYSIPPDNPFVDGGGAPEVYSYGYRNPFRLAWVPDLGLVVAEPMWREKDQQVSIAQAGGNVGYPLVANAVQSSCYENGEPVAECTAAEDGATIVPPAFEYPRDVGSIVSGAVPYAGAAVPELAGQIVVSDWSGTLVAATPGAEPWPYEVLDVTLPEEPFNGYVWALDSDASGEVYVMVTNRAFAKGAVYRLVP